LSMGMFSSNRGELYCCMAIMRWLSSHLYTFFAKLTFYGCTIALNTFNKKVNNL
jgi:hypothetical protein